MKLGELASRLGAELRGDANLEVTGVKGIDEAGPAEITFVANPRYAALARTTRAAAVIVEPGFQEIPSATLRIKNPYLAFSRALGLFYSPPTYPAGIHPTAVIDSTAEIGEGAHIGPYAVVGPGVHLGTNATLLAHVVLYPGVRVGSHFFAHAHAVVRESCILGDHVTLENGVIIGSDGFGFAKNESGHWEKIPQSGPVRLGNRVDVQANATIDRATIGATEIGDGSKVDNLVQIGHGSRVGENTLICAQTGLAGSSVVGNNVILAGQVGIAGHCTVGDNVILTAQSAVSHDVPPGKIISGSPGFDNRTWLRAVAVFQRLPDLIKRIGKLEARLAIEEGKRTTEPRSRSGKGRIVSSIALRRIAIAGLLPSFLVATGCHSYHIDTTIENHTGITIKLVEVDYPSASFGFDALSPEADFHYRIQIEGSGPLKITYTAPGDKQVQIKGPDFVQRQQGRLEIVLLPGGKAEFHPELTGP